VLIVAGSARRRAELERILWHAPALHIAGALPAIEGVKAHVELWHPDVVLMDVDLNPHKLEPLMATLEDVSGVAVVLLADHAQPSWIARALRSGVAAILQRDSSPEQISAAVRAAVEELTVLGSETAGALLEPGRIMRDSPGDGDDPEGIEPVVEELTRRELEVLQMVAAGLGNREIASRLGVSGHTIKFHISSILGKLGASSRTEAVTQGIKRGLILL
jgi:DNA-binding NarL/FixJ family response regulator